MSEKVKIVLAEDNELFRRSLSALLKTQPGFDIAGEAKSGKELLTLLKQKEVDIVLLNVDMPAMSGKEMLEIIRIRFPEVKVIVLNNHASHNLTIDFMALGARCYITTNCEVETLFEAIKTVEREGYYFDNSISKAMLGALIKSKTADSALDEVIFNDRETEIIKAICDGKTSKEIAFELHVSVSTIDFHKGRIYEKANCDNITGLLRFALKKGIVMLG